MKHIVIDARIRPSSTGRYVDRLMEHLQKIDTENTYTVLLEPGDNWQPTAPNFTAQVCPYKRFTFNLLEQITYGRYLRKLNPDLVHFSMTPLEPIFYFGKRITTTHDLTMLRYTRAGKTPLPLHWARMTGYRFLFWYSHKAANRIIAISKFVANDIAQLHPFAAKKTIVTYESSEPPLKAAAQPLKGVNQPFIMHTGIPFPHKNLERLVQAFELMKEKQPDLQLVLSGKKEYYFEEFIKQLATSPVRDSIIIPGFVTDPELKWLYEHAEAYVLPALSEGFGLPGLEAMAHGCPLVSSNATCLPEVYGEAALYFDPENIEDIAAKVGQVIDDKKLRKELTTKGQAQLKKYSWERMAEQTLALYNSVL
ncbi:MAG TPA: glycosyltransferase family 1 protein [Verrucomicrobiae bacterium]|nr:glycosyltransferase family 1 protein [Verrucomicrobiae bacterium]